MGLETIFKTEFEDNNLNIFNSRTISSRALGAAYNSANGAIQ